MKIAGVTVATDERLPRGTACMVGADGKLVIIKGLK